LELEDGLPSDLKPPVQKIKSLTKEGEYSQEGMTRQLYGGIDIIPLQSGNKRYDKEKAYDSNGKLGQKACEKEAG